MRGEDDLGVGRAVAVAGEVEDAAHEGPYGFRGARVQGDGQVVAGGGEEGARVCAAAGPAEDAVAARAGEGFDGELRAFEVLLDEQVGDLGVAAGGGPGLGLVVDEPDPLAVGARAGLDHARVADQGGDEGERLGAAAAGEGHRPGGVQGVGAGAQGGLVHERGDGRGGGAGQSEFLVGAGCREGPGGVEAEHGGAAAADRLHAP
ncbi:hypothetical protein OG625_14610 [Streptomyces sp. NBC_01351]|nr:hypothetical protein [Streptomyces sp. NBC_01351]